MGKVVYAEGIQYVSGALHRPKKVEGHSHGQYLIGTHRSAPTTNPDCTRLYIRNADTYVRKTKPSSNELRVRAMFSAVSRAANTRPVAKPPSSPTSGRLKKPLTSRVTANRLKVLAMGRGVTLPIAKTRRPVDQ